MGKVRGSSPLGSTVNCVYILKSLKNNTYYIGSTNDIDRRLKEHSSGRSKYTREILPIELVFIQEFQTLKQARKIELKLKKFKNKNIINRIIVDGYIAVR